MQLSTFAIPYEYIPQHLLRMHADFIYTNLIPTYTSISYTIFLYPTYFLFYIGTC